MDGRFVSYYRVSTARQGQSGLGLDAQRATVAAYLNGGDWKVVAEFTEVESGRQDERPELARALAACRARKATLIVANVSRLTRSVAFLSRLLEAGVDVRFCDMPQIEGATGRFLLQQMVAVAELEAGMVAERTRKALAAAKARGQQLGGVRRRIVRDEAGADTGERGEVARTLTDAARDAGRAASIRRAAAQAADLSDTIASLRAEGVTSLGGIARRLNQEGITTARGGQWSEVQVSRVLARLPA